MMGYLLSHAARIYGYGNGSIVSAAKTILHHAARIEQPFTMRDIARKGWTGINTETIQGALDLLIDYGHVTATATTPSVTGGRPTTFFNFVSGE
jgi:predicted ArsR family transcriptional regulator